MTRSPLHSETLFESEFSLQALPFLTDHRVHDRLVVPAACHLTMLFSAAEVLFGTSNRPIGSLCTVIQDVIFPQALLLPEDESRTVQVVLSPTAQEQTVECKLISFPTGESEPEAEFLTHATGRVALQESPPPNFGEGAAEVESMSLERLKEGCPTEIASRVLYENAAKQEIIFGPAFQWVDRMWVGDGQVLSKLQSPSAVNHLKGDLLPLGLLDACFQVTAATTTSFLSTGLDMSRSTRDQDGSETFLPFAVAEVRLYESLEGQTWWCYAQQIEAQKWDIQLLSEKAQVLAEVKGFEVRSIPRTALYGAKPSWHDWLYRVSWRSSHPPTSELAAQTWLIFADQEGLGSRLAKQLHSEGHSSVLVVAGNAYRPITITQGGDLPPMATVNPREPQSYQRLLDDLPFDTLRVRVPQEAGLAPCQGVIYFAEKEAGKAEWSRLQASYR